MRHSRGHSAPDVSVLTPSLNYGRFIRDNLVSVELQSGVSIQHVVQDACSTDDTVAILRAGATDWLSEKDSGQSDALNRALNRARGRYVSWLNADEFYLPLGLSILHDALNQSGADVVYADPAFVDEAGRLVRITTQHRFSSLLLKWYGCFITSCATMFRKETLAAAGWDTSFRLAMDWDLYLRLASVGARFQYVPLPVAAFRLHPAQVIAQPESRHAAEFAQLRKRHDVRGKRARAVGRWPHDVLKLTSGVYLAQVRARALRGKDLRWFSTASGRENCIRLVEVAYRKRHLGSHLRAALPALLPKE